MKGRTGRTIAQVAGDLKVSQLTLKKWEKKGLVEKKLVWDERQQKDIRLYTDEDVLLLRWLKKMGGPHQSNELYLKLLLEYIKTGRIDPKRLGWPMK